MNFDNILIRNPFMSPFKRANILRKYCAHMGEDAQIFPHVSLGSEPYLISFGKKVKITYGCKFITHDGGTYVLRNLCEENKKLVCYGKIRIGDNVFIGNDSIIMPGVSIGNNVVIGAGSVVTKSIPSNSVAAGVPCRVISSLDNYEIKVKENAIPTIGITEEEKREMLFSEEYRDKLLVK